MKKYEMTDHIHATQGGRTLHRIRALINIPKHGVKAGDLGGWIETENNLSHEGDCWVDDNAWVDDSAWVNGNAWVEYDAQVKGNARVDGNARVAQHGVINSTQDYLVVGPIGSRNDHTTFYRTVSDIWVRCGCFNGPIDEFANEVRDTHGNNRYAQEYLEAIDYAKSVFERRNRYAKTDNPHA